MRSLRSTRKIETSSEPTKNKPQDENKPTKMCHKVVKPGKVTTRAASRPALTDKTNSGSDLNQSSSPSCDKVDNTCKTRPKRNHQLPSRLLDHELSPVVIRNSGKPKYSSTPLSVKSKVAQPKRTKNTIAKNLTAALTTKSVASQETNVIESETKCVSTETKKTNTKSRKTKLTPEIVIPPVPSSYSKYSFINRSQVSERSPGKANQDSDEILIEDKLPANEKSTAPIYKSKLSFGPSKRQSVDRLALYEFEVDPGEALAKPKKKQIKKKSQPRKKKPAGSADDDAAMKMLIEQLKKIQESALLKKLAAKKKIKQNTLSVPRINFLPLKNTEPYDSHRDQLFPNPQPSTSYQRHQYIPGTSERIPSPVDSVYDNDLPNDDCDDIPESNFSSDNAHKSSFFTDMPVASSSMISHADHKPAASPWRVNYNTEQKRWPYNFHVKASMTPSYQRDTFHVLGLDDKNDIPEQESGTNGNSAVLKENTQLPSNESEINTRNLKQTSILSFYEESMKKTTKKPQPKTLTENYSYEEYLATLPKSPSKKNSNAELSPSYSETQLNFSIPDPVPAVVHLESIKEKPAIENCFGFDDSDEIDQENISPVKAVIKNINVIRGGGTRMKTKKGILKERNQIPAGPTRVNPRRALNPITAQNNNQPEKEKDIPEVIVEKEKFSVNDDSSSSNEGEETVPESSGNLESKSTENDVALFEDPAEPEFVHFNKPSRRSYEIRKRPHVKFNVQPNSDDENFSDGDSDSSVNPTIASHKTKKAPKKTFKRKNVKTKKENKEADDWAAGFNSMLEEVDDFALCIE